MATQSSNTQFFRLRRDADDVLTDLSAQDIANGIDPELVAVQHAIRMTTLPREP